MEWLGILCRAFLRLTGTEAAMVASLVMSKSLLVSSAYFDTATGITKQRKKVKRSTNGWQPSQHRKLAANQQAPDEARTPPICAVYSGGGHPERKFGNHR